MRTVNRWWLRSVGPDSDGEPEGKLVYACLLCDMEWSFERINDQEETVELIPCGNLEITHADKHGRPSMRVTSWFRDGAPFNCTVCDRCANVHRAIRAGSIFRPQYLWSERPTGPDSEVEFG
jgi:hypothetical protein